MKVVIEKIYIQTAKIRNIKRRERTTTLLDITNVTLVNAKEKSDKIRETYD